MAPGPATDSLPTAGPRAAAATAPAARPGRPWGAGERGSFTAELAAGLPALVLLLLAGLTAVEAVTTRAGCLDAAREAALAASRGEPGSAVGARYAPAGADISVTVSGDRVTATVRAPVRTLGARLPRITVSATAVAAVEPGIPGPRP
ncbi:TadE family type IV pilus minor pilin [Micromonospora sp. SL4-19]|uniref:TadE family type IV pilus minor pilin n=1 Tax=Micromonospora sp. SL4-19 TaxID=3399129 RepID=UPI003A4DD3E2